MENNLLDSAKSFFNEEVVSRLASTLGEDKENIKKGADVSVPALFLGLQSEGSSGLGTILDKAKRYFGDLDLSRWTNGDADDTGEGASSADGQHGDMLQTVLGSKSTTVVDTISGFLGLNSATVQKVMGVALPAVFSSLTNKGTNWDLSSITNLLNENKSNFAAALPAGMGLGAFGTAFSNADVKVPHVETPIPPSEIPLMEPPAATLPPVTPPVIKEEPVVHTREAIKEVRRSNGIWWLLIPLVLIALWFLFGKSCGGNNMGGVDSTDNMIDTQSMTSAVDTQGVNLGNAVRNEVVLKLSNGEDINAYANGIEDNLIKFLQSDYKSLPESELKNKWFDFDNLNFETGTAKVLPESKGQLDNLAAILKVFPEAKVKIGGYTDKTGDESFNKKLSLERANTVKAFLEQQGLGSQVAGAEGYGSEFAAYAANAPESDRIKDRRVSVSVR